MTDQQVIEYVTHVMHACQCGNSADVAMLAKSIKDNLRKQGVAYGPTLFTHLTGHTKLAVGFWHRNDTSGIYLFDCIACTVRKVEI